MNQLIAEGVTPDTMVWCEGMANWTPASNVPEVAALFSYGAETTQYQPQEPYQQPQQAYQQPQQAYQQPQQPYQQPQQPYNPYGQPTEAPAVGFVQALKICFSKYVDFSGRARRSEYWWFVLWAIIIGVCTCGFGFLVTILPMYAAMTRRLHDTGRSGWWVVGYIVIAIPNSILSAMANPVINSDASMGISVLSMILGIIFFVYCLAVFVFTLQDSQKEANKYGPSPKY
ncbi:MAG: DUF805 domain-containing protein [Muribaculaceae bacterium]|nr:DUF805 domain-containing protein [Muribaculaceae bacterium]